MPQLHIATLAAETAFNEKPLTTTLGARLARQAGLAVAGSAFVAVCAHISVPLLFTPVPLTMQNFAVLLLGLVMEPAVVLASMVLYLIEGASGLPVFTPHGPGGILQLFGPSGGFLLAYPVIALFASLLVRRIRPGSFGTFAFTAASASGFLYVCGSAWFSLLTHSSPLATLKLAVLPFMPGDALKVLAAASIAASVTKLGPRTKSLGLGRRPEF